MRREVDEEREEVVAQDGAGFGGIGGEAFLREVEEADEQGFDEGM